MLILIKNARVMTMEGNREEPEVKHVLIEDGKIKSLSTKEGKADQVIDAKGHLLLPGFIDAHCHLGMWEDAIGFEGADGNEMTDPLTPGLRAIDGINPMDRTFEEARNGGVTSVATGPGSANCMGGSFAAIKTKGARIDEMIIKDPLAMKIAFGENPKRVYDAQKKSPSTRMAIASKIREALHKAKEYQKKKNSSEPPAFDIDMEALLPVLEKKIPLKAHAHRADDIFTAIRIAKEFDVLLTLDHATEGHLIADELVKEKLDCIVGPSFGDRSKYELKNQSFETAAVLNKAGVKVAIMTDHPVIPVQHINMCAQYAVRAGMDHYEALKAITINPAQILGIDDRVGSIKKGKDADLVLWNGDPLNINSRVLFTMIDGEIVYMEDEF